MEEGKLAKWVKAEGEAVRPGDVIAEIETDKATMEIEAVDEGKLGKILVPAGTEGVKVNTPIAVILTDGEDATAFANGYAGNAPSPLPLSREGRGESPTASGTPIQQARPAPSPLAGEGWGKGDSHAAAYDAAGEIPEGTETVQMTVREALRDAMAEEMRRDEHVFVMGEEVAEYQGAYKITQGLLDEFGPTRVDRHAHHRGGLRGARHRARPSAASSRSSSS